MKLFTNRKMTAGILLIVSILSLACSKRYEPITPAAELPPQTARKNAVPVQTTADTALPATAKAPAPSANSAASYYSSISMTENISNLNRLLDDKYRQSFTVAGAKEYEAAGKPSWTIITDGDKAGFDIESWKYNYELDSDDSKYMDAVLTTFVFFYGEDMGNSLWRLTNDLFDGGADEKEYDFRHNGGQIIYKDTRAALIGYPDHDETYQTLYIWITPDETGEYKDVID